MVEFSCFHGSVAMSKMIEKEELFKCHIILNNRGRLRYFKSGRYGVNTGSVRFLKWVRFKFGIPDNVKPMTIDCSTFLKRNRSIPLFIVNDLDKTAIGMTLIEISNPDLETKINLLIKRSFWEVFGENLKMGLGITLIYMLSGYGLFRFIEYIITRFVPL
jgi:hypothetical protein